MRNRAPAWCHIRNRVLTIFVAGVASYALSVAPAAAFHIPGATYDGTHAQGGTVSFAISPDGSGISRFTVTGPIQGSSCTFSGSDATYNTPLPIVNHAFSDTTPPLTVDGSFNGVQSASGSFKLQTGAPFPCSTPPITWNATTTASPAGSEECRNAEQAVDAAEQKVKKAKKAVRKADTGRENREAKKKLKKAKKKLEAAQQQHGQVC